MENKTSPEKKVWVVDLTGDDDGDGGYIEYRIKVATGGSKNRCILVEHNEREAQILKIDGEDVMEEWFAQLDDLPYLPESPSLHESLLDDDEEYSALQRSPHLPDPDFSTSTSENDDSVVMFIPPPPRCARRLDFERVPPSTPPPDIFLDASKWVFDDIDWPHVENLEKEIDNPCTLVRDSRYPSPC